MGTATVLGDRPTTPTGVRCYYSAHVAWLTQIQDLPTVMVRLSLAEAVLPEVVSRPGIWMLGLKSLPNGRAPRMATLSGLLSISVSCTPLVL